MRLCDSLWCGLRSKLLEKLSQATALDSERADDKSKRKGTTNLREKYRPYLECQMSSWYDTKVCKVPKI